MESILGGILNTSTVSNTTKTRSNPHGGQLTEIGDGIGLNASVSSEGIGSADIFVLDYSFMINNTSLTEDSTLSFAIDYNLSVYTDVDAFIDNRLILEIS